jgi:hypothetical protein
LEPCATKQNAGCNRTLVPVVIVDDLARKSPGITSFAPSASKTESIRPRSSVLRSCMIFEKLSASALVIFSIVKLPAAYVYTDLLLLQDRTIILHYLHTVSVGLRVK